MGESGSKRDPALVAFSQAALAISRELSLQHVLQQIVDSARDLASARYAALGVFDRDDILSQFVFSGMSTAESERIGAWPSGRGLLRAIMDEGHTIRVPVIAADPRSTGFPSGHPPMRSFLGVPIVGAGEVLGNLYLTERIDSEEFSEADAARIEILAAHAAIALRNARLFHAAVERGQELALRNKELGAINAVARAATEHLQLPDMLTAAVESVLAATDGDAGVAYLRDEPTGDMILTIHRGAAPEAFQASPRFGPDMGLPGRVALVGRAISMDDLRSDQGIEVPELLGAGFRSLVYAPLWARAEVVGVLGVAAVRVGAFTDREITLLEAIGHQIGTAVVNARLTAQVGKLAVRDERTRIGMDLHDGVIQSIYAVGLNLQSVRHLLAEDQAGAAALLDQAVAGLNDAIRDIRNFILDLRPRRFEGDLSEGLARLVREFQANTLVQAELKAPPDVAVGLPLSSARAIFLTTQESLANIARHSRATHVAVRIERREIESVLTVEDDGVGFDVDQVQETLGHGLANMRSRAEEHAGRLEVQSSPGRGTTVRLTLPLPSS